MVGAEGVQDPIKHQSSIIYKANHACDRGSWTSLELVFSHRRCYTPWNLTMEDESPMFSQQWLQFGESIATIYWHFSK